MHEQWYDMFNTGHMVYFMLGLGIAAAWNFFQFRKKNIEIDLAPLGIIMGVSVIVFVAIQQVGLAAEVKRCNAEVINVLQERAKLSDESDATTGELIDANSHWLARLTSPPPEIAALHTTDPVYRGWVQMVLKDYLDQVNKIHDERAAALEARKEKMYPTPTCGK